MPRESLVRLAVPESEIDAFGELRASGLARILQQVAIEASIHAGFDEAWYTRAGTIWLIRRSTVEVHTAARPGDLLEVTTRVADFRRVRSRREYEVRRANGAELVAAAHTDWVYLDRRSGKLCRIPAEMIEGFLAGDEAVVAQRSTFEIPAPPPSAFAHERQVEHRDIDGMLHANNAVYIDYVGEAFWRSLAARGWRLERLLAAGGFFRPCEIDVEYLEEARAGDRLRCVTWAGDEPAVRFGEVRRADDETLLTRARTRWAWIDLGSRGPVPIPAQLREALEG